MTLMEQVKTDYFAAAMLEAYWAGHTAIETSHQMGLDPLYVADMFDQFHSEGF